MTIRSTTCSRALRTVRLRSKMHVLRWKVSNSRRLKWTKPSTMACTTLLNRERLWYQPYSGGSYLTMFFFAWGIFCLVTGRSHSSTVWQGVGINNDLFPPLLWTLTTLILMGVIYLKFILPDTIIVKHSQNKYVPEHVKDWKEYKWWKPMAKDYNLFVPESKEGSASAGETVINRRQFLGFVTATGVLAASLGVPRIRCDLFYRLVEDLLETCRKFWAKGREDTAWYGQSTSNP